jgi:predicted transcriptional regulator
MPRLASSRRFRLSPQEARVMRVLWRRGRSSAEEVAAGLGTRRQLNDSTIRTLLRRLESKGCVEHEKDGKRFRYRAIVPQTRVAAAAAQRIIETICGGAVESLLLGLIESETISAEEIERIRSRVDEGKR